jgi:hypothetical protein
MVQGKKPIDGEMVRIEGLGQEIVGTSFIVSTARSMVPWAVMMTNGVSTLFSGSRSALPGHPCRAS